MNGEPGGSLSHMLIVLATAVHVAGGAVGLVSGTLAAMARKGGALHRAAGKVFVAAMLLMAAFAVYLGFMIPDQLINVFIGSFAFYLVATAWMAARRKDGAAGNFERFALVISVGLCAPFAILSFQLDLGVQPLFTSAIAFEGPVLVALHVFTLILALAVVGDARVVVAGGIAGVPRVSRHLWRMCLGLSLAAGSGFTNGLARLLPGPYHVPPGFFLPQFLPLGLLVFWMIRVRTKKWPQP